MPGNAPVVRAAEVDLVSRPLTDALSQRRAAVLREAPADDADRLVDAATAALKGNWQLLDGVTSRI